MENKKTCETCSKQLLRYGDFSNSLVRELSLIVDLYKGASLEHYFENEIFHKLVEAIKNCLDRRLILENYFWGCDLDETQVPKVLIECERLKFSKTEDNQVTRTSNDIGEGEELS